MATFAAFVGDYHGTIRRRTKQMRANAVTLLKQACARAHLLPVTNWDTAVE